MTKPVALAGLLGGLLGAVFSLALARALPAPVKAPTPPPKSEARQFADDVVQMLKAGKHDQFFAALRPGFSELTDDDFKKLREGVLETRKDFTTKYGEAGELEFSRETAASPSLVRVTYVEKYQRGCIAWVVVVYNSPAGWQVLAFNFPSLKEVFATQQ